MRVSSVMRSHVVCVGRDATPVAVADVFAVYQQPVVPVVDESDRLVGVIRPRAVMECLAGRGTPSQGVCDAGALADTDCPTASIDDDGLAVVGRMLNAGLDAVVALDGGKVAGLMGVPEACRALALSLTEGESPAGPGPSSCEGSQR